LKSFFRYLTRLLGHLISFFSKYRKQKSPAIKMTSRLNFFF